MTNRTKSEFTSRRRIAAKTNFLLLLLFPASLAHARYSSRMIDRFLTWGDQGKPKSGKIKGICQPPCWELIIESQQAYSRRKDYFDHFSVAQVIIVRVFPFFIFNYIVLFSFCKQIFFFTRCSWLFARKRWTRQDLTKRAKQTLMCSFLYFLMIQFAEFNLLEWRPWHGPVIKNS